MPVASSLPVAPVHQSLAGEVHEGHASQAAPPARAQDHAVVIRHQAPEAPAFHDQLARKFADQQGTVPGAGPVFTPTVRPRGNTAPQPVGSNNRIGPDRNRPNPPDDRGIRPAANTPPNSSASPEVAPPRPAPLPPAGNRPDQNRPDQSRQGASPEVPRPPSPSGSAARQGPRYATDEPHPPAGEPPPQGNPEKRAPSPADAPKPPAHAGPRTRR